MALTGRSLLLLLLGAVPLVLWPERRTLFLVWAVWAVVVLLDAVLAPSPKRLSFSRTGTPNVRLGEATASGLVVTNTGRRRIKGKLRDAWQPTAGLVRTRFPLDLPGGERRRLQVQLVPTRRGDRHADRVTVRANGPLGLAARQRSFDVPGRVRVLPPFHSRRHLPSRLAMLRQLDGRSAVRTRGQGTEFDSLREYVEGDDVRSIDWRATARRQHLVVRTWQPERDRRVVLVLDTSRTSAARVGEGTRLDAMMEAGLLLTALASRAGDRVDLIAGDRTVHTRVRSSAGKESVLQQVVEAMAPVDPALVEPDWSLLCSEVSMLTRRQALVVLLTPLEPASVIEGLVPVLPAISARHRVVVASVADPSLETLAHQRDTVTQAYLAAGAERDMALRDRAAEALRRTGATVIDTDPERLPVALADHYLELKARGLL